MEPIIVYYNNLTFNDKKRFSTDFSNEDLLEGIVLKKNENYYIMSMTCYADFTIDITKLLN